MLNVFATITAFVVGVPILFCVGLVTFDFLRDIKAEYQSRK